MAQHVLIRRALRFVAGGGVRSWAAGLTGLLALGALLGGALLTLGPAGAQEPGEPAGLRLTLELVEDSDNVVQAGQTIEVRSQVRFEASGRTLSLSAGELRISGALNWEAQIGSRLPLPTNETLSSTSFPVLISDDDITGQLNPSTPLPAGSSLRLLAYDGDTIAARAFGRDQTRYNDQTDEHPIYVFKASTGEQLARIIDLPRASHRSCRFDLGNSGCPTGRNHRWSWGRANDDNTGSAVAVWQQDDDTAWMFVGWPRAGAYTADGYNRNDMGALVIFEIDYSADPVTVIERHRIRVPSMAELRSRGNPGLYASEIPDLAYYGVSVAVSADGSTLAVGAHRMHDVGAVYVYTRPTGGWRASFGGWNGAVRVSPVVIPPWGDVASERPFEPQAASTCDAYCRSVSSFMGDVDDDSTTAHALFGYYLALSADGSVLAVSAPEKRFSSTRAAGSGQFRGGRSRPKHGEVFVFTAPTGGWSATPNYKTGRTELGYSADASSFSQSSHYNSGPNKRVQAPAWSFSFDWSSNRAYHLGERLALSPDGTTLAASDRINDAVNIFQVDSPSDWASGPTAPSAQITGVDDGGRWGGFGFSRDNARLALGDPTYSTNQGRVLFFSRLFDGSWIDADASSATALLGPNARAQARYGRALAWNLNGDLLAVSATEGPQPSAWNSSDNVGPGRIWTQSSPIACPIESRTEGGETTETVVCGLDLGDTSIVIPPGARDGTFTISGTATVVYGADAEGQPLSAVRRADLELRIGEVDEVTELKLGRATDDRGTADTADDGPYPAAIADGETTTLLVQVLNENGAASAANSVSLVSLRTPVGELSTEVGGGCRGGNGGLSCIIEGSALTANNSDKILVTLRHAGTPGAAELTAAVYTPTGEQLNAEPLSISLTGAPTALAIAQPPTGLLGIDTPDEGDELETVDNRDLLTLSVSAADANGAWVAVPGSAPFASLTGPDGSRVTRGVALDWPLLDDAGEVALDSERNRQVRINVNRGAGDPLANGEYTLSVRSGGLTATQTFSVSGGAARVELSEPSAAPAIGEQFTITATIRDAEGAAVPNGTRVRWEGNAVGETPVLVQIGAETVTSDGQASSTWLGVDTGRAHIRATADSVTEVQLLNIAASQSAPAAATTPRRLADSLSAPTPGALVSWLGAAGTTASALLADLDNVGAILGWRNGAWLSYSVSGGRPIPGSTDFAIRLGDVLWLGD